LVPELTQNSVDLPLQLSAHYATRDADQNPADEYPESWTTAFTAAAVLSLVLTLLAPSFLHRATHLPADPAQNTRPAFATQPAQNSVPNATLAPTRRETLV